MPTSKCDGGKDSWHGGKERVIQAAKPLGTGAEGLPFAAVLLAAGSVYDGGGLCLRWRWVLFMMAAGICQLKLNH